MLDYKVVYVLLPHDVEQHEYNYVLRMTHEKKRTVGFSADDAGATVMRGAEGSVIYAWEPERIGTGLTQEWFNERYPGAVMKPMYFNDEFVFSAYPTVSAVITQAFGANPEYYSQFGLPGHEGIDFRAVMGSPIYAVSDGVVVDVHPVETSHNYGIYARVKHVGDYETTYAHFERALVNVGDHVSAGSIIGLADDTGNSYGSHLHLTLKKKDGQPKEYPHDIIDPTPFLYGVYTHSYAIADIARSCTNTELE